MQDLARPQPLLPLWPGQVERHMHDHVRNGTTSLFAAWDAANGEIIGKSRRRRQQGFFEFLEEVDAWVSMESSVGIDVVLDNYAKHETLAVKRCFL